MVSNIHLIEVYVFISCCVVVHAQEELFIGGLFDVKAEDQATALELAIENVNQEAQPSPYLLSVFSERVSCYNTLSVSRTACYLMQLGIIAIFGPNCATSSRYMQSLCDIKEMPLIETHWELEQLRNNSLLNLYPYPPILARFYVEIVKAWKWHNFIVLYEDDSSLYRLKDLLRLYNFAEATITLRQLISDDEGSYRMMLLAIKRLGIKYFLVDCSTTILRDVLLQAQQVGLMTEHYSYIILNFDMHTIDLTPYQYGGTNITGIRLLDPNNTKVRDITEQLLERLNHEDPDMYRDEMAESHLRVETALVIDGVSILIEGLKELHLSRPLNVKRLSCKEIDSWEHGYSFINFMKTKMYQGLTGHIKFDNQGFRSDVTIEITELTQKGLKLVGTWNTTHGMNLIRPPIEDNDNITDAEGNNLRGKSLRVIVALTPPYAMLKETSTQLTGNDRYEGYAIDLIQELSQLRGFTYTFIEQEDGSNGNFDRNTGQWSGMIRQIIDKKADLAVSDLTITSERQKAVDFTMPFLTLGISILYKEAEPIAPDLFSFAQPFSLEVWLLLGVSYFLVSLSLFIMGRLSPREWTNPYPCIEEPQYLYNQFSFRNSLWFTIGSLMQQGSEIAPMCVPIETIVTFVELVIKQSHENRKQKSISTRMVAGMWWFFTLIMVSSYTANLAAFLTVENLVQPFETIEELVEQDEIGYGAKADGATANFFRDSNISVYPKIWKFMSENPGMMTSGNDEGVKKVENGNYAYFMESSSIEYVVERHCSLAQIGTRLDEKGYGIAMIKDSKYRHTLTTAVLKLRESGTLSDMYNKWWKQKRSGHCDARSSGGAATPLGLQNLGGVFFVLGVGTFVAFIGTFVEMTLHVLKVSYKEKLNFKKGVLEELKFFLKFKTRTKKIR